MTIYHYEFFAFFLVFVALTYLFAKNLKRARATGEIYSRSILVRRIEQPISFWVTVVTYAAASLFTGACAIFSLVMAAFPDKLASIL
jgi:hypothetical protein